MKQILTLILVACLGACSGQNSAPTNITFTHRTGYVVTYVGKTTVIDTTVFCEEAPILFSFEKDGVRVDDGVNPLKFEVVGQMQDGVYYLEDGSGIPILLHIYKDKREYLIYIQKANLIIRLAQKPKPCDEF